jgi:galactofuranosylgalactofuranosylrhamnosyl-N-acetylglucosaminyl-diphospho-decaprenol beta-1,5/1,6-galactofuranosyltransferase
VLTAATGALRQLTPERASSRTNPEAAVQAQDARWWLLSQFDSAVVSTADGAGAAWYKRDRERARDIMKRSIAVHEQLLTGWNGLATQYRAAVPDVTSPQAWFQTWGIDEGD